MFEFSSLWHKTPPKTEEMEYDVFISYRRDGGEYTARILRDKLTELGYRVFFDVESLRSGDFNVKLYSVIEGCRDFVLVLSPGALDRCVNKGDWVKNEIEHAIRTKKNIVPVLLRGFSFPEELPESIADLPKYSGLEANSQFFDAFIAKLREFLETKPSRLKNFVKKPVFKKLCAGLAAAVVVLVVCLVGLKTARDKAAFEDYVVESFIQMGYSESTARQVAEDMDGSLSERENLIAACQPLYTDTTEQVYAKMTRLIALGDFDGAHTCAAWWQNKALGETPEENIADVTFALFLAIDRMMEEGAFAGAVVAGLEKEDFSTETPLMVGDIIVSVNGEPCRSAEDYQNQRLLAKDFYSQVVVLRPVDGESSQYLEEMEFTLDNSMPSARVKDLMCTEEKYSR